MIKIISTTLIVIACLAGGVYGAIKGVERAERAECIQWQADAGEASNWYATSWQASQCEHYGITLK